MKLNMKANYSTVQNLRRYLLTLGKSTLHRFLKMEAKEQIAYLAELAKKDMKFLCEVILAPPNGLPLMWFHKEMIDLFMYAVTTRKLRDVLYLVPRECWKTTLITEGGTIWIIINNPDVKVMINGINLEPFGKKVMGNIKGHFESNALFRDLFPKFCPPKSKKWDTQFEFLVPNCQTDVGTPTCMIGSFGSPRTGFHYDYIINDDPHNEDNTQNVDQMDKIIHCWEAQEALGKGYQTVRFQVATFWHHADLNNHMINLLAPQFRDDCESGKRIHNQNYLKRLGTDTDLLKVYLLSIRDTKGESIWSDRLPNPELERKELKMGRRFFKMQYENNVIPEEEQTFKPHYFRYYKRISRITDRGVTRQFYVCGQKEILRNGEKTFIDRLIPYDEVVNRITVDPAYGVKDYNDEVAIVVVGHWTDPEMRLPWYLLLDYVARKMEISESQALIEQKVEEWNAKDVGIESHAQVMYLNQVLRESRWAGPGKVNFIPIKRMSEKIVGKARVRRLQPVYESGRFWHAESMRGGKVEKVLKSFVSGVFVGVRPDLADALGDHVDFAAAVPIRDYAPLKAVTQNYGTWDDDPDYAYVADDNAPDWETM